jgi:dTDP-4-amino-4,6-dideoxygalactose transaminase
MTQNRATTFEKPALFGGPKTREEFLVFSKPHFGEEEIAEVVATIKSGWVGTGPRAAQLEKEFAQYVGVAHAVAMNSCTAALHVSYACLDLRPGDEVIVPAMTFGATANAVVHAGGTPVFVDIDPVTLALDPKKVELALSPRTRAIVLVHFAGRMGPAEELAALCRSRNLALIEDCAHAIETTRNGHHAGTLGFSGCYSFYANKNVSTAEGGMFVTNDARVAERARKLALHGMSKDAHRRFTASGYQHYDFDEHGFKYNMPDIAAALGIHQLRRVEKNYELRRRLWNRFEQGLRGHAVVQTPPALETLGATERHALHLYQIQVPENLRDPVLSAYAAEGIGVGIHYRALTDLPLFQKFISTEGRKHQEGFAVASTFGRRTISLPLGTAMTQADVDHAVAATLKLFAPENGRYFQQ